MNWLQLLSSHRAGQKAAGQEPSRSAFEQDYDRIIFSHPFRRLQDKTQVHPLPEHDFVHTRLTHSLEVSSVGRSLGKRVGEIILQRHGELNQNFSLFDFGAIVAAASLAHDLGNPPFGHAGESAISDFFLHHTLGQSFQQKVTEAEWADLIRFEGNAQGFRILHQSGGMYLTAATLGAFTKYPCPAFFPERAKERKSQKKFGFFQTEKNAFAETASQLGLTPAGKAAWNRHPLAFLVEAADDICYNIIDLEDGCRLGLISFEQTVELLSGILRDQFKADKLQKHIGLNEKLAVLRALTIGKLTEECATVFLDHENEILEGKFDKALADSCLSKSALDVIASISREKIYRARTVVEIEASGHAVLPGLLEEFVAAATHLVTGGTARKYSNLASLISEEIVWQLRQQPTPYLTLRNVIDFVSGLTDRHAINLFRRIKGC